jgi:UDP-GlcNAc3NAcA epimerase
MLEKIEEVLGQEKPASVLVYGDTNSTLAGALAARKLLIPVCHVEAGLRSRNMAMPEEVNRILTDRISDVLFCPTKTAIANLQAEGFSNFACSVVLSGDVMLDAAHFYAERAASRSSIVEQLGLKAGAFALCTIHRAENTDDPRRLEGIAKALDQISAEIPVVLPIHPRTAAVLRRSSITFRAKLIDPVGYLDMVRLIQGSSVVLTDSGGLQKEAFFFRRPCVTLRDETEWTELVEGGFNRLAGADAETIVAAFRTAVASRPDFSANLYGEGQAGGLIARTLTGLA